MKFLSIFEEENKTPGDDWAFKHTNAFDVINNEVKKAKLGLFFDAHDLGYDLHNTREESQQLVKEFDNLIEKIDKNLKEKSLVVDTAFEADAGGGFDIGFVPNFSTIVKAIFVFVILQSTTGFLQEAGKEFYTWIKNRLNQVKYKQGKHAFVVLRGKHKEAKFLFVENLNEETFEKAWKEMLKFNVDKLDIEEYEERIYIFDPIDTKWVIFS